MRIFGKGAICAAAIMASSLAATRSAQAQFHTGDIGVGRSALGQLKVTNVPFLPPYVLQSVNGPIFGFANNSPGFDHIDVDDSGADFYQLQSGAQVKLRMLSVDGAFKFWNNNFSANIDAPGEELVLGNHQLHYHGTWHIDSTASGYDPDRPFWEATFVLIDTGTTGYAQSAPFTVRFANRPNTIPTVSEWGLVALMLVLLASGTIVLRGRGVVAVSSKPGKGSGLCEREGRCS